MNKTIPQSWFEMADLRRRRFENAVWVPLRAIESTLNADGSEECFYSGSVAIWNFAKEKAEKLGWDDIGIGHDGGPFTLPEGGYKPAEVYLYNDDEDLGVDLIFDQHVGYGHQDIWHVNQDLVLALRLIQEGDSWLKPDEGYCEVIKQTRDADGRVIKIEIRQEHLKDYLCARRLYLRIAYYRQRMSKMGDASHISWARQGLEENLPCDRFTARTWEIDEDGGPFGAGVAVFHCGRTDVDLEEDVPVFGPANDTNTDGHSWTFNREGRKAFRVEGELWREEWIGPGRRSERIRGDKPIEDISFVVDAAGNRELASVLDNADIGRWLWFDPKVIMALSNRRGGNLSWYTQQTGVVRCSHPYPTHFGVNRLGLINVYAYDVAKLPQWQQRIWVGYNVAPDGGVCPELLTSQMEARPADTRAPEELLPLAIAKLDRAFTEWIGEPLFRSHDASQEILKSIHRFRALDVDGIFALSKDLVRLIIERIEVVQLHRVAQPPKGEKWGSLKSLEKALGCLIDPNRARQRLSMLVGLNEMRKGDAHLPSASALDAIEMVGLMGIAGDVEKGEVLIGRAAAALYRIAEEIERAVAVKATASEAEV